MRSLHRAALFLYRGLPRLLRRWIVRTISPKYTVGAMCIIERDDGAILLVRHTYRRRWGVPGGLLKRREGAEAAVRREVREEVGMELTIVGEPAVVVDAAPQRVDLVFRARPASEAEAHVDPRSVEIREARWFPRDELPALQFEMTDALITLARVARTPVTGVPAVRPWDPEAGD